MTSISTKECKSCRQKIKLSATKCHICSDSQGKSRIAQKTSLYAGAFIAVVSLATMGYESAKKLFDRKVANLTMTIPDLEYESLNLVVSNHGSRPAVIYDVTIKYPPSIECSNGSTWTMRRLEMENKVIDPGKTYSISNRVPGLYKAITGFDPHAVSNEAISPRLEKFKVCSAQLTYLDFDGSHKTLDTNFHCGPQGECPGKPGIPAN